MQQQLTKDTGNNKWNDWFVELQWQKAAEINSLESDHILKRKQNSYKGINYDALPVVQNMDERCVQS